MVTIPILGFQYKVTVSIFNQVYIYIYVCIDTIIASSALFTYCVQAHAHSLLHMLIKESLRWFVKQKLRCMVNKKYLLKGCNKGHNGEQHKENTHTHLYLYYHCYVAPIQGVILSQQEATIKTGGSDGSGSSSLIFPVAWPSHCSRGTHLWACKTHEMRKEKHSLEWRHQDIHPGLLAIQFPIYTW